VKVGKSTVDWSTSGRGSDRWHTSPVTLDLALTEAAIRESVVANLVDRDVVVVKGPDAASFLHGQLSQNVERLAVGDSALSFLLHPQGKVAAWGRISRVEAEEYWFDVDPGFGEDAAGRLQRFLLRVKCTVEFHSWPMVQLRGLGIERPEGSLIASIGSDVTGYDILGPGAAVPDGVEVGEAEAFEAQRIGLRRPAMGAEINESTIPAEVGIVNQSADFEKGCYVGQELVARVDSRGSNTPRKMHGVSGEGVKPAVGTELTVEGEAIGMVTSAASLSTGGWVGLASIKRSAETPCVAMIGDEVAEVAAVG
jgi:folate-binding protein YgfZ